MNKTAYESKLSNNAYTRNKVVLSASDKVKILDAAKALSKDKDVVLGTFSTGNQKLNNLSNVTGLPKSRIGAFDVLAGKTCPFADICRCWCEPLPIGDDGKQRLALVMDANATVECYAASIERRRVNVWRSHVKNTEIVSEFCDKNDPVGLATWIIATILKYSPLMHLGGIVRWHASGDFFRLQYVIAADIVQQVLDKVEFFGYSKSPQVVRFLTNGVNAWFVHSDGSKFDDWARLVGIPQAFIRLHKDHLPNLPTACKHALDPGDFAFIKRQESFALELH